MSAQFLSRFTPSLMDAETLEAIFVQREAVAQRIVESIRESALTKTKHHTLVVGPRGMGKTHLVSLVYHRLSAMDDLRETIAVAWLHEEAYGVGSFLDLLLAVLHAVRERYSGVVSESDMDALYALAPKAAELRATQLLDTALGSRTLLVITENLDDTFAGLGAEGQQRLRSYVQERRSWTILATTQSLFGGVKLQTSPFYGFFRVIHLEQLSLEDAIELLAKIAMRHGDDDLAAFIRTPRGRARVRALHHLAGGNPRVYVILSQFLTRESLDELVELFLQAMDDLTPYYQARMQWISVQQRKIVSLLVERRGAVPVKHIAQRTHVSPQTVSSQLKMLREMGYVISRVQGRESYYELREPLMRYALDVKRQRGEPVGLIVELLRIWYSRQELSDRLALLDERFTLDRVYFERALSEFDRQNDDPRVTSCVNDYTRFESIQDWPSALQAAEELVEIRGSASDLIKTARCLVKLGRDREALAVARASADAAIRVNPHIDVIWAHLGSLLDMAGDVAGAVAAFDRAESLASDPPGLAPHFKLRHAQMLIMSGNWEAGLQRLDQATVWPVDQKALDRMAMRLIDSIPTSVDRVPFVTRLLEVFAKYSKAYVLGAVMFIRAGELSRESPGTLRTWSALWHEAVARAANADIEAEVRPFLDMLAPALDYAESGDERVLLRLPVETRRLLEPLFDAPPAAPTP